MWQDSIFLITLTRIIREEPDKFYEAAMQKAKSEAEKFYASHTCGNPVVIYYKFQMRKLETLTVMFGTYDEDAEEDIPA